jgi:hypothetical protein
MVGKFVDRRVHKIVIGGEIFVVDDDFPDFGMIQTVYPAALLARENNGKLFGIRLKPEKLFFYLILIHACTIAGKPGVCNAVLGYYSGYPRRDKMAAAVSEKPSALSFSLM